MKYKLIEIDNVSDYNKLEILEDYEIRGRVILKRIINCRIHKTVELPSRFFIGEGVLIDENTRIGNDVVILGRSHVQRMSSIHDGAFLEENSVIGEGTIIGINSVIRGYNNAECI